MRENKNKLHERIPMGDANKNFDIAYLECKDDNFGLLDVSKAILRHKDSGTRHTMFSENEAKKVLKLQAIERGAKKLEDFDKLMDLIQRAAACSTNPRSKDLLWDAKKILEKQTA